jgi:beta-glucosidase
LKVVGFGVGMRRRGHSLHVTYGYYHGYRYADKRGIEPRFPFGFGLSYTTYRYTNLTIAEPTLPPDGTLHVTADITNTGGRAGDEIVQLYVSYEGTRVDRPVRDLKAFTTVHLQPGETKTAAFAVPLQELAFYDVDAAAWVVETITYTVHVGSSSRDLPLNASFAVSRG